MNGAAEPELDPYVGSVVEGRYRVLAKLGEGGMGAVYEAEQIALSRRVAFKVIHSNFSGDGEVRARFTREATASGQLDGHPHVASALDFGTLPDGSLFLVMQLVKGPSLRDVIERGRLPWERALAIGTQIADALSAAHARGIVHRDLKPDNVALVTREDGREIAKVLDFGIAGVTAASMPELVDTKLTRVGTIMGTPGYMAPEQAVGDAVDARADLYALGVVLYEMLTGVIPFDGPDLTSIVAKQFAESARPPSEVAGDATIPPELDAIVLALLARSPGDRPSSASEVHRALDQLARGSAVPEPLPAFVEKSAQTNVAPTTVRLAPPTRPEGARGRLAAALDTVRTSVEPVLPEKLRPHALAVVGVALALPLLAIVLGLALSNDTPETHPLVVITPTIPTDEPQPVLAEPLTNAVQTLVTSEDAGLRGTAASQVLAASDDPAMPPYAVALAELEKGRNCRAREAAIARLVTLADARAIPPLERIANSPRRGCGFLDSRDCHGCIRDDVDAALTALRSR